jgi:hypothetical protein
VFPRLSTGQEGEYGSRVRPRLPRLVVGVAFGFVVVSGGLAAAWAGGLILHDTSRPASVEQALARFRASDPVPSAADGVYLYATAGSESVDALGGARHVYPATTTVSAIRTGCGVRLRWAALEDRSTTWLLCGPRLDLRTSEEMHRFFGQRDRTAYSCRGSALRPSGATRSFRCRSGSGVENGRIVVVGTEAGVLHVRTTGHVSGGDRGTEDVDWWLAPGSAIPTRIVLTSRTSRKVFIGRVHYREDVDLRLRSRTPLR